MSPGLSSALLLGCLVLMTSVKTDLPIHCIMAQVEGDWTFKLSPAKHLTRIEEARCGHESPSQIGSSMRNVGGPGFPTESSLDLRLDRYNQVYGDRGRGRSAGTWTMMYDEGFIVSHSDYSFFAFFSYSMTQGKSLSDCSQTLVGWYRDSARKMGCFFAVQTAKANDIPSQSWGDDISGIPTLTAQRNNKALISLAETNTLSQEALDRDFARALRQKNYFMDLTEPNFKSLARTNADSEEFSIPLPPPTKKTEETKKAEKTKKSEKSEKSEKAVKAVKAVKTKKSEKTVKSEKAEKTKKTVKTKKSVKSEKTKKTEKSEKSVKAKSSVHTKKKSVAVVKKINNRKTSKTVVPPKSTGRAAVKSLKGNKESKTSAPPSKKTSGQASVKASKLAPKRNTQSVKTKTVVPRVEKIASKKVKASPVGVAPEKVKGDKKAAMSRIPLQDEREIPPWEDPRLKIEDKDYHVRRFWMNMNINWIRPNKQASQLAETSSAVVYSGSQQASPVQTAFDARTLVDQINQARLGWTATEYPFLAGKSFEEINLLAGRPSAGKRSLQDLARQHRGMSALAQTLTEMPSEFSLESHLSPVRRQRSCGNCYLIASVGMLEARIKMRYGRAFPMSIQYINDCNHYAQGCNGGFAYEVLRFMQEFWAPPESCKGFYAAQGVCGGHCEISKQAEIVTVDQPYYVGDMFGKTTEQLLMQELYSNGPVVVSFEPMPSFTYYKGGIYTPLEDTVQQEFKGNRQWMKVDHSVLLYGWGEENGVKFWKIQNSWGPGWGENGSFRIVRGKNILGIESLGEAANPRIVPM